MRKGFSYIYRMMRPALAMLAVSACTGLGVSDDADVCREYPVLLSADAPELSTRISVDGIVVGWEPEDRIQITAISAKESTSTSELTWFSDVEGKDSHFASFSGFVTMRETPQDCYFIYPVRSSTSFDVSSGNLVLYMNAQTGLHEPFMYAYAPYDESGIHAKMNHVGAMLEIDVNMQEVTQITFAGNRLEKLSPVIVDPKTGDVSFSSEDNVQITVPVSPDGKTYISVPPVNMEKGFSLICSNADATKSMIRSFSSDGGLGSGYDFSQKAGQIIPIVLDGELVSYSITSTAPVVEHTKTSAGLLSGTSVKFTMNKSGVPDKMIEEWGATLVNSEGVTVRTASYTNADPIRGTELTMNVANDWKLLPEGQYTFTPYYIIYGRKISMSEAAKTISIPDPGVKFEIHGKTSYDKYLAGDIDEANGHVSTLIEGVAVTVNVDLSIIDSYSATLDGKDMGNAPVTSTDVVRASYGDLTKTEFRAYDLVAAIKVGAAEFKSVRSFHITGLPYSIRFDGNSMQPTWTNYNITLAENHYMFPVGTSYIVSPRFHAPANMNVLSTISAYAYGGWGSVTANVTMSARNDTNGAASGTPTTFEGVQYYPEQATWTGMERQLVLNNASASRICIHAVVSKGIGLYAFGPGLLARSYDLKYR